MMSISPQISVIIPIYNAERYLKECLDSVIAQTFKNFELILVNDGSNDRSLEICQQYAGKDERIRVIEQENQGASPARNNGLEASRGKYILFIDADDWMESNMIEELYSTAEENDADIVGCAFYIDSSVKPQKIWHYPYSDENTEKILKIDMGYSALWNKLIRRQLYVEHEIKGIKGITMWDDNVLTFPLRLLSRKTICIDTPLYHYRVGIGDSMCDKFKNSYPHSEIAATEYLCEKMKAHLHEPRVEKSLANIKVLAKDRILISNQLWGGVKRWKKILPVTTREILSSQIAGKRAIIRAIINIIPSSVAQRIVNILGN